MPTYHRQELEVGGSVPTPAIEPLTGGHPAVAAPAVEVMRAQDRVASLGRRIVFRSGLAGSLEWRVPNTNPEVSGARTHPDTTWYEIGRTRFELTPGCALRCSAAVLPSGVTQKPNPIVGLPPDWVSDGAWGRIRVTVTWRTRDGHSTSNAYVLATPHSTLTYGAESDDDGALFRDVRLLPAVTMRPPSVLTDLSYASAYGDFGTTDIVVEVQGSPRIFDLVVHEEPDSFTAEEGDDASKFTQHLYADGSPGVPVPPPVFAKYRNTDDDPRRGTLQILRTARAQHERLAPMLFSWHAYNEQTAGPTTTKVPRTTANDGTTFESILDSSVTTYAATNPGWSVSCGGYARSWNDCNYYNLLDRIAVVPVLVRVYGRTITAGTGTVRIMTAPHSYVDVDIPIAGSNGWSRGYGYLEVGITPEQPVVGQIFFNHAGASGSLSIEDVVVYVSHTPATL